ncbi:hypothetical protein ACHAWF_014784, partial [Thalassiosira exigua]
VTPEELERQTTSRGATTAEQDVDPVELCACFNAILFEHGKSYRAKMDFDRSAILERLGRDADPAGRTCLFLPLRADDAADGLDPRLEIDWRVVRDVVHHRTTHVLSRRNDIACVAVACLAAAVVAGLPAALALAERFRAALDRKDWNSRLGLLLAPVGDAEKTAAMAAWLSLLLLAAAFRIAAYASTTNDALVRNRFLVQPTGFKGRLFVAKATSKPASLTSRSLLIPEDVLAWLPKQAKERLRELNLPRLLPKQLKERLCELNLPMTMTHEKYCKRQLKRSIWIPMAPLIHAHPLAMLTYTKQELTLFRRMYDKEPCVPEGNLSAQKSISNLLATQGQLIPELTRALPLPRDMVYLFTRHVACFMPKLERTYSVQLIASRLEELRTNAEVTFEWEKAIATSLKDVLPLIDKATSVSTPADPAHPTLRMEERLEALGDSVLLFFIVLNIFVQSAGEVEHALDFFEEVINLQGKNKSIFQAALYTGLPQLLHMGTLSPVDNLWRSRYNTTPIRPDSPLAFCPWASNEFSTKQISDAAESLLGATYLIDQSGCMTVGYLNEIGQHLPSFHKKMANSTPDSWFTGRGTCLTEGYALRCHSIWAAELAKIEDSLQRDSNISSTLQKKAADFCQQFSRGTNCHQRLEHLQTDPTASLLLQCALFDDCLHDESQRDAFKTFANLRDKIFHVGNAALQLSIVLEVYRLHANATSGDIHLMKVIILSHDALAYIFVKNNWHEFLFDTDADEPVLMKRNAQESDLLGAKEWEKNGGWAISGGLDEFRQRILRCGCAKLAELGHPRYAGLAAGRLWGHSEKLPDEETEDLSFSMKCVVGALALSLGLRDAWDLLRPIFLELMLLSPDEIRSTYEEVSPLARAYKKGRR